MYDEPDTIFNALREVFRPIGNRTMSIFKFKSLKQKQGATIDAYMAELKALLKSVVTTKYATDTVERPIYIWGNSM